MIDNKGKYFLQPGYAFASLEPYLVSTVLGSCVSVCLWDEVKHFGGMNHYIYPKNNNKKKSTQFGNIATEHLIHLLIKMGAQKNNIKAHLIGGSQNPEMNSFDIGKQNIEIAEKILKKHNIYVVTQDTGSKMGRKVVFDTETGEIAVYSVHNIREYDWYADKSFNNR